MLTHSENCNRAHGYYPIEDSIPAYRMKRCFPAEMPATSAVSELRIASLTAIAREDDALDRRQGGLSLIFYHDLAANTPLPIARAGAAVTLKAYREYCEKKSLDPLQTLIRHGTREINAKAYLEYANAMYSLINTALESQDE